MFGAGAGDHDDERAGSKESPSEQPAVQRPGGLEPEEPATSRDESAEPAGEEDPANEQEMLDATEEAAQDDDPAGSVERERDEYLALAQRTHADFENYRKRAAREAAAAGERARGSLVRELLPVLDNLERALASAQDGEQHLAEGVKLVHSELVSVLERNGVEQFDPAGERFDPTFHEALSTREEGSTDSGVVLDVIEKGYRVNGAVLRPARVVVSD
ncbi:MAG: nucleotide exchange factor GrpE [Actinomycetota bacterium]|nr:nucleotide exchange factor GrpE [Actinomycetota bacterium]